MVALARRGTLALGCFIDDALSFSGYRPGQHPHSDGEFVRVIERYADELEARS